MILTPYILNAHEPIRMRYMKLKEVPPTEESGARDHVLTVDILTQDSNLHVLLKVPDWSVQKLANRIENICSTLLMLMDLNGLIKAREKVFWYELSLYAYPKIDLHRIHFTDDGSTLSIPRYEGIPLKESPFDLSPILPNNTPKEAAKE